MGKNISILRCLFVSQDAEFLKVKKVENSYKSAKPPLQTLAGSEKHLVSNESGSRSCPQFSSLATSPCNTPSTVTAPLLRSCVSLHNKEPQTSTTLGQQVSLWDYTKWIQKQLCLSKRAYLFRRKAAKV